MWRENADDHAGVGVGDAGNDARVDGLELVNMLVGGDNRREA